MEVDLDEVVVGDHEHALAYLIDVRLELPLIPREALYEELRAVAPRFLCRMGYGLPQALPTALWVSFFEVRRGRFPTKSRQNTVQDHGHPQPSSVYDPCLL
jgi:hypothetical protein